MPSFQNYVNRQLAVRQPILLEPSLTSVLKSFIFQAFVASNCYLLWRLIDLLIFNFYLIKIMHFERIEQSESVACEIKSFNQQ